jgi:tetratricopeptide (TPR) repeat protein
VAGRAQPDRYNRAWKTSNATRACDGRLGTKRMANMQTACVDALVEQAVRARSRGQLAEAGRLLNKALVLAPQDSATIIEIGRVHVAEDRVDEAIAAFKAALALAPDSRAALMALGAAHAGRGEFGPAAAVYRRSAELAPDDPDPLANLAFIDERLGRAESARTLAEAALRLHPEHALAALTLARLDLIAGNIEPARARLESLLKGAVLNRAQRLIALNLLGDALHGLDRPAEAFATYTRMKSEWARNHAARFGVGGAVENHLSFMLRLERWFLQQDPQRWKPPTVMPDVPVRRHVFLLGYLRSGVTLVDSILASLPDTRVLEEESTLNTADEAFLRDDASLAKLSPLDPQRAATARAAYWGRAAELAGDLSNTVLVDMAPINGIKLPMIAALFPAAVVVQCRRDPRDVVLSCFRRNFKSNALTFQLTTLESIARHYDAAMRLTELHLERLGLPVHVVEYSRLVVDFDGVTQQLAEFVDVPWSEAARQFGATAARRRMKTASASQVRRGLFDGSGQWLKYRAQLEPVLPILEPWITRFGYEP